GFVDRHAEGQRHELQVRQEALVIRRGQRGEKMIFSGAMGSGRSGILTHALLRTAKARSPLFFPSRDRHILRPMCASAQSLRKQGRTNISLPTAKLQAVFTMASQSSP